MPSCRARKPIPRGSDGRLAAAGMEGGPESAPPPGFMEVSLHRVSRSLLALGLCAGLGAQTAPTAGPAGITWRGSLWASAVTQDRDTADGSLAFRPLEQGQSQLALDGLLLGVDAGLGHGWSARASLLTGHLGKVLQASTGDTGSVAPVEAMLVWTGPRDTLKVGRMMTFIGMEFLDGTQDLTASRGLLFTYADPFGQVGINWHHAFSPSWSSDAWVFNGEDRTRDNNSGKTVGLGLTYNHLGSADDYLSLQVYRGPEQDGLGSARNSGAEGRLRERLCLMGQWVWGRSTVQGELSLGRESFLQADILGSPGPVRATWRGMGLIAKVDLGRGRDLVFRGERLADDTGVRLALDPSIREALGLNGPTPALGRAGANLVARSWSIGVAQRFDRAFVRFEVRRDSLNLGLQDAQGKSFRDGLSGTLSLGGSF